MNRGAIVCRPRGSGNGDLRFGSRFADSKWVMQCIPLGIGASRIRASRGWSSLPGKSVASISVAVVASRQLPDSIAFANSRLPYNRIRYLRSLQPRAISHSAKAAKPSWVSPRIR
jgi:hypothetical protein